MRDGFAIRRTAAERRIPCFTSLDTARAAIDILVRDKTRLSCPAPCVLPQQEAAVNREICEVVSNIELMPGIYLMWLQAPEIARRAHAGQFVMVACGTEQTLRRPISVHSVEHDKFALLYAVVGKGTEQLTHLKTGSNLDVLGPMGNGFQISPMPAGTLSYLMIAGGIGIAPLRFLVEKVKPWCRQIIVLQGAATASKLYPKDLLPKK